jgi:hypothetical protein
MIDVSLHHAGFAEGRVGAAQHMFGHRVAMAKLVEPSGPITA